MQARSQDFLLGGAFQKKVDLCWGGGGDQRAPPALFTRGLKVDLSC